MRRLLATLIVVGSFALTTSAQTKTSLPQFFEGKQVKFRIGMPATGEGLNIYPDRSLSLDYADYNEQLRSHGVSINRGEVATITRVRIKDNHIEVDFVGAARQTARFNLRYTRLEVWMLTPLSLIDGLNRYVEFGDYDKQSAQQRGTTGYDAAFVRNGVVHLGPRTTYLREGLKTDEVVSLLGEPAAVSERYEGSKVISVYEFERSEGRVLIAEFVSGTLVSSRTETRTLRSVALLNLTSETAKR